MSVGVRGAATAEPFHHTAPRTCFLFLFFTVFFTWCSGGGPNIWHRHRTLFFFFFLLLIGFALGGKLLFNSSLSFSTRESKYLSSSKSNENTGKMYKCSPSAQCSSSLARVGGWLVGFVMLGCSVTSPSALTLPTTVQGRPRGRETCFGIPWRFPPSWTDRQTAWPQCFFTPDKTRLTFGFTATPFGDKTLSSPLKTEDRQQCVLFSKGKATKSNPDFLSTWNCWGFDWGGGEEGHRGVRSQLKATTLRGGEEGWLLYLRPHAPSSLSTHSASKLHCATRPAERTHTMAGDLDSRFIIILLRFIFFSDPLDWRDD